MRLPAYAAAALAATIAAVRAADNGVEPLTGEVRVHYIAADFVDWDYAPGGNLLVDMPCCADGGPWLERGPDARPPVFRKAVFREYTDESFTRLKPRPAEWEHAGILGPILRVEVGDRIEVTLKNNTDFPLSLHPHGLHYIKPYEGARYADGTSEHDKIDDAIAPGDSYTYRWGVPTRAGPGPNDPSSILWLYHSHVNSPADVNTGLFGAILVTRNGSARPDGSPADVDREFITLFFNIDEADSRLAAFNDTLLDPDDPRANRFHSINGLIYGNLPRPRMKAGERVRWYLAGLGGESDLHTPHWHGGTVVADGHRTDVIELLPASMKVADMIPDNPGTWMYHCHVNEHIKAGQAALYEVAR